MFAKESCASVRHCCRSRSPRSIRKVKYSYQVILMSNSSSFESLLLAFANVSVVSKRLQAKVSEGFSKTQQKRIQKKYEASFGRRGGNAVIGSDSVFLNRQMNDRAVYLKDGLRVEGKPGLYGSNGLPLSDARRGSVGNCLSDIPVKELKKIAELRFSRDLHEGDSGEQVALLQRALFWLNYYPREIPISGYFGLETKQALQKFQNAYRVANTGLWGSLSREAFWDLLSTEILHRMEDEKGDKKAGGFAAALDFPLFGNHEERLSHIGSHLSQKIIHFDLRKISENVAVAVSTPDWKVTPDRGGIFLIVCVVLVVLLKLMTSLQTKFQGQPVKRRILRSEWYMDTPRVRKRAVNWSGQDAKPLYYYSNSSLAPITEGQNDVIEQLVIHDGKVLRGTSKAVREKNGDTVNAFENSARHSRSKQTVSPASLLVGEEHFHHVDSNAHEIESHQFCNGIDNDHDISRVAEPEEWSEQEHGLIPWLKHIFSDFELKSISSITSSKKHNRRTVVRNSTRTPRRKVKRRSQESRVKNQRSSVVERASISTFPGSSWQEEDEHNLNYEIEELRKTVETAERNRQAAMRALAEERQRSLELEVKISRQRKAAAALEEEVRVLKESHDALLASLRKKYRSSAAARAAAALLYQKWDTNGGNNISNTSSIVENDGVHGTSLS
eukprot:Gb_17239 [translate_table: standard]